MPIYFIINNFNENIINERIFKAGRSFWNKDRGIRERLISNGCGESKPMDNNDTHEGKADNGKIEFVKKWEKSQTCLSSAERKNKCVKQICKYIWSRLIQGWSWIS